ncbi:MAG: EAL domain-containing protein [Epsilonproteobacteria bacterium]|nr:EAL domain-containing protein [Campylobacterota bacterium]
MRNFIKNVRLKVFILFLIPAVGLVYFSSSFVYENYQKYKQSLYLEDAIEYVSKALSLMREIQKERGLSLACLEQKKFCNDLKKQYSRTDVMKRRFLLYLLKYDPPAELKKSLKELALSLGNLQSLRDAIRRENSNHLELLDRYSDIISKILDSTAILEKSYINTQLFKLVISFNKILEIAEINGQERALILDLLYHKTPNKEVLRKLEELENELKSVRTILDKNMPYQVTIIFQNRIPRKFERSYEFIKHSIIYRHNFDLLTTKEWWIVATSYIDRLFRINEAILKLVVEYKNGLKKESLNNFYVSALLWLASVISLLVFLRIFSKVLNDFLRYVKLTNLEKHFFKTFSEFSQNLLFVENTNSLLGSYAILLSKTGFFKFVYVIDCNTKEVLVSENIPISAIKHSSPKQLQHLIKEVQTKGTYKIARIKVRDCKYFENVNAIGCFPLILKDRCKYLLIVAVENKRDFGVKIIDLILKMNELFCFAIEKFETQQKEKELKEELKLIGQTFETHEAIVITDKNGNIQRVNKAFEEITGYTQEEVQGKNPSILKSGKHDKEFYAQMWDDIKNKGYWKGEIYNKKKDGTIYPEILSITAIKNDKGEITNYVSHFFDISDLKEAQAENERRANYDTLTEVFNRKKLLEELEIVRNLAKKGGFYNAFLFIDLDNFKQINDSYGHSVGDKVLVEVANRLRSIKKERDILARLGGDEFAFILVDISKDVDKAIKAASIVAQKLIDEYSKPVKVDDLELEIGFSIGVFIFPTTEKNAEEIIINADIAMYHNKRNGKNGFSFYNEKLDIESKQFLYMKKEIEEGLKRKEFLLHYQPKVEAQTSSIVGFEALLRWNSKSMGFLYPDKFLPYAYGNNLLYKFTNFVIDEVFNTLTEWKKEGLEATIAVNISTEQFNNRSFMNKLAKKMENPLSRYIVFEIVEDAFIKDASYAISLIEEFKALGVKFAIDDFGTGYSSLNYLRKLPVDEIKIDKSFVMDMFNDNNDEIVKKIVEIAKVFHFKVTAEGVENKKSVEFLRSIGCDYFQGFYFSRPVEKESAKEMLKEQLGSEKKTQEVSFQSS